MRILVTAASRHGSTVEVAEQIARILAAAGAGVDVRLPAEVADVSPYDAVVLGSAVYYGAWLPDALAFLRRHEDALAPIPLWLFSVGALVPDGPARPASAQVDELVRRTHARGHRAFRGALEVARLSWTERVMVAVVRAPYGDFRNWTDVRSWAHDIGAELGGAGRVASAATSGLSARLPC